MTIFNPPFYQTFANKPHHKEFSRISQETLLCLRHIIWRGTRFSFSDFSCRLQIADNSSTNFIKLLVCACMHAWKCCITKLECQGMICNIFWRNECFPFDDSCDVRGSFSRFHLHNSYSNEFTAKPNMCVKMWNMNWI